MGRRFGRRHSQHAGGRLTLRTAKGVTIPLRLPEEETWVYYELTGMRLVREKGREYFRKIQAKRKTRAGGRPPRRKYMVPTANST